MVEKDQLRKIPYCQNSFQRWGNSGEVSTPEYFELRFPLLAWDKLKPLALSGACSLYCFSSTHFVWVLPVTGMFRMSPPLEWQVQQRLGD